MERIQSTAAGTVLDLIGIGFGPSNLALAVALAERRWPGAALFLEKRTHALWQKELLLEGSDIQHNALRDLITPVNPRSRFGFLSYLQEHDRLFQYLNLPAKYAFREDYARYVQWAARQFDHQVKRGVDATELRVVDAGTSQLFQVRSGHGESWLARSVVLGLGRRARVPPAFEGIVCPKVIHSSRYLSSVAPLAAEPPRSITVVGASQSAVEILLDLRRRFPTSEITSVQRGFGFQTKDTSPFTHHVYFPSFADTFFSAPEPQRHRLWSELRRTNYSAADEDVVNELYCRLYEDEVRGERRLTLLNRVTIRNVTEEEGVVRLWLQDAAGNERLLASDLVVLATGFQHTGPSSIEADLLPILEPVRDRLRVAPSGLPLVGRDYAVSSRSEVSLPPLYLNGMSESTHGFGDAGTFSLVSIRADEIARSLLPRLERGARPQPLSTARVAGNGA